jgi:hypothetical protein
MAVMERASAIPSATRPVFPVAGHRHQLTPDLPGGLTLARRGHSRLRRSVKHEALVSIDFSTCFLSDNERSYTRQVDHGIKKMMGTMRKKVAKSNDDALAAFVAKKVEIDLMLTRLGALSDDHFGVAPDEVTWSDVGSLEHHADLLKRITDMAVDEGEHAA